MVVDEQTGPGQPLPVEFAPCGLGPSRVGDRQVQAALVQVVPQQSRGDMPQRIGEIVGHHLRLPGRSRGEVHHHDVVVGVHPLRAHERSRLLDAGVEIKKPFGDLGAHADQQFGRRAFGHGRRDVVGDHPFTRRDDGLDPGHVAAIDDVLFGQQVSRGDRHRTQLVQRQNREPELVAALEYQHHHIALSDAEALEIRGRAVAFALDVGKGELDFGALVVGPQQRLLAGLLGGVCVHHVVTEIEILRNPDVQVFPVILLRREGGLGQESFYHTLT